jgi:hypothetical protein
MILEIKRLYIPVGHSEWERRDYIATVWMYDTDTNKATLTVHEIPDEYTHGLLSTWIDSFPVPLPEFDEALKQAGFDREKIHKEIIA